ncbi:molybdopterin-binding protein [Fibrella sp. WM1]|uniref:molybdopterin-binding protein n=1 Tax=Fibrella musci TaxID=3242485 RepID=UPI003522171C
MRQLCLLLAASLLLGTTYAQTLTVSGAVAKPLSLEPAAIKAMPHTEVTSKDRDGQLHRYSGVPLIDLLKQAGVKTGSELRGKQLLNYLVVKAADGYEVVFSLPELDPELATRTILLADSADGAALPTGTGPYRIIVPDEKKPTRWVRGVISLDLRSANP